jgi:phenylalanyl-tRNA synthetase beta chain
MKVPVNWLREYVDLPEGRQELQRLIGRLEMSGLAMEGAAEPWAGARGIVAGRVMGMEKHPELDKLVVAQVDLGPAAGKVQLVSGATNFQVGDVVPVVAAGGALPGGRVIGEGSFRGVLSQGMMCSPAELGLGQGPEAEAGIMILLPDTAPGSDCIELLGLDEQVLELDLTPNYAAFCQNMVGVAREVTAITGGELREPAAHAGHPDLTGPLSAATVRTVSTGQAGNLSSVVIDAPDLCGRYSGALFAVTATGPSPLWMQQRLVAAGLRPLNNLVDVTNYVMLELGQPLHAFDFDTLDSLRIVVRRAAAGERIATLDGAERQLSEEDLVIADAGRAVAIAGVMGGANTEIGEGTKRVFLESAHFAPTSVRRTSRRLGLRTEASTRFEKGVDPSGTVLAIERASTLLEQLGAARRIPGIIDVVAAPLAPRTFRVSVEYIRTLTGAPIDAPEMIALLESVGITARLEQEPSHGDGGAFLFVEVPTRRPDIEGNADIAEEVARRYGYERISAVLPSGAMPVAARRPRRTVTMAAGRVLLGFGLSELVTFSFHSAAEFDRLQLPPDHPWRSSIPVSNPMNEDQGQMRTSLIPNLLRVLGYNAGYGVTDLHGYEISRVYVPQSLPLSALPQEPLRLAVVLMGRAPGAETWAGEGRQVDFYLLKGVIEGLACSMRLDGLIFEPCKLAFTHPGRTAAVSCRGREIGWLGELSAGVADAFGLRQTVYLAELDFETMIQLSGGYGRFRGLPRFPAVQRDLAFVVPDGLPAAQVAGMISGAGGPELVDVRLFDVYKGAQVGEGKRSLAYALTFRSPEQTLTDEHVDRICELIVERVQGAGGVLRAQ